jgi:amylosucrase
MGGGRNSMTGDADLAEMLERGRRSDGIAADATAALAALYPNHDAEALFDRLLAVATKNAEVRPPDLRSRDRSIDPEWFQSPGVIGYVAYADRFAGDLAGVRSHLDYLNELGVTYVHLMSVMRPREGENDGGYAIADYRDVDPKLGTTNELVDLIALMHERSIAVCIDLVMNHTADTHEWANAARAGDETKRAYYLTFPDRTEPDRWETTLPEVFPTMAPGNFTWDKTMGRWVWTTFNNFQWDLNYANPDVLVEMLDTMCFLANLGVDVLRLDAVAFTWKRPGTDCQNQPEAHLIVQVLRALFSVAAPSSILQAEAIVGPDDLVQYLGAYPARHRRECTLAYHNQLMVLGWSAMAEQNVRLATAALNRMRAIPSWSSWCTYVRCHDDIGWAITDEDAGRAGVSGASHRRFLAQFYRGAFFGSYAEGVPFSANEGTGDERTSGSAAALVGIDKARRDGDLLLLDVGVRRLLLLYGVALAFGGIPLIYMGDELALANDHMYTDDPAHADDSRWIHRPVMDWSVAERRHDPTTVEGRVFSGFQRLIRARTSTKEFRSGGSVEAFATGNDRVLGLRRWHPEYGPAVVLASFSAETNVVAPLGPPPAGSHWYDVLSGDRLPGDTPVTLAGYGQRWLTAAPECTVIPLPGPR